MRNWPKRTGIFWIKARQYILLWQIYIRNVFSKNKNISKFFLDFVLKKDDPKVDFYRVSRPAEIKVTVKEITFYEVYGVEDFSAVKKGLLTLFLKYQNDLLSNESIPK